MKQLKKLMKYFIIFLAFYFLSNFIIIQLMKTTYQPKKAYIDQNSSPKVEITDFKATVTNGYVNGKITNDSNSDITGKYLKLDFYSKNGTNLGTKYVEINDLKSGDTMDFSSQFNYDNVDSVKTSIVEQKELPKSFNIKDLLPDNLKLDTFHAPWYIWLGGLMFSFPWIF